MKKYALLLALGFLSSCTAPTTMLQEELQWTLRADEWVLSKEGSGLSFHEGRGTFFLVTDQGSIAEMDQYGELLRFKDIGVPNMEGVTSDPTLGNLYAVIEGRDRIIEIDPDSLEVLREFTINRKLDGEKLIQGGKEGFEGITFVADSSHPQGGTFYVVNQATANGSKKELSAVIELELPIRTGEATKKGVFKGTIVRAFASDVADLSGIHFDNTTKHLWVLSDTANLVLEMNLDGTIQHRYGVPGVSQEGITGALGMLYIVEDQPDGIVIRLLRKP